VGIRQFQRNVYSELKNLPFIVLRDNVPVFAVVPLDKKDNPVLEGLVKTEAKSPSYPQERGHTYPQVIHKSVDKVSDPKVFVKKIAVKKGYGMCPHGAAIGNCKYGC